jgi:hypothetical protein
MRSTAGWRICIGGGVRLKAPKASTDGRPGAGRSRYRTRPCWPAISPRAAPLGQPGGSLARQVVLWDRPLGRTDHRLLWSCFAIALAPDRGEKPRPYVRPLFPIYSPWRVFHEVSRAERPSQQGRKTPAFRPVDKLKHTLPVFHEISRAEGPGQQTTKNDRLCHFTPPHFRR